MAFKKLKREDEVEPEGIDAPDEAAPANDDVPSGSDAKAAGPEDVADATTPDQSAASEQSQDQDWTFGMGSAEPEAPEAAAGAGAGSGGGAGAPPPGNANALAVPGGGESGGEVSTDFAPQEPEVGPDPEDELRADDDWYQQWKEDMHQTLGHRPGRGGVPQGLLSAMVAAGTGPLRERLRQHRLSGVSEAMHGLVDSARTLDRDTRAFDRTAGGEVAARLKSIMDAKGCGLADAMGIVMKDPRHAAFREKMKAAFQDPATMAAYNRMAESMERYREAGDHMSETMAKTARKGGWKPDGTLNRLKEFVSAHEERVGERLRGVPPFEQENESLRQRLMEMAGGMRGNFANILQMLSAVFRQSGPEPEGPQMGM